MAVVYQHVAKSTGIVFYVGIGRTQKRAFDFKKRNAVWKGFTRVNEFEVTILKNEISWEEACLEEIRLIKLYGRKDKGTGSLFNHTDGGSGPLGRINSDQTILKMKLARGNTVVCRDLQGNSMRVSKEEFDAREDLVGVNTGILKGPHSDSAKENIRRAVSKQVQCLEDGKIFLNCAEAAQFYKLDKWDLGNHLRGNLKYNIGARKYSGGLHFNLIS